MTYDSKGKISIIIPILNEAGTVGEIMDNLEKLRGDFEIIFVDGGSDDGTDTMVEKRYSMVRSPRKGRSFQMNYGALLAQGSILLFLHADCRLSEDALDKIRCEISKGSKVGCFRIRFDSPNPLMKVCSFLSNLRVRKRNIAFGDQGIFISKNYFNKLGGYREIPIMEDYQLSMDIKSDGEDIVQVDSIIETSERRFLKDGRLKTMYRMQRLQHMYRNGKSINRIAGLYD